MVEEERMIFKKQLLVLYVSVGFQTLEFGGHPRKLKDSKHQ